MKTIRRHAGDKGWMRSLVVGVLAAAVAGSFAMAADATTAG
jgi:hypothetical protein